MSNHYHGHHDHEHHDHHYHEHHDHEHHGHHYHEHHDHHKHQEKECHKHDPDINLLCGRGFDVRIFENDENTEIAFLEVDTKCIPDAFLKIDVTSIVSYVAYVSEMQQFIRTRLRYRLVRENSKGRRITLGEWYFRFNRLLFSPGPCQAQDAFEFARDETFCFTICDKIVCPDCYVYKVIVSAEDTDNILRLSVLSPEINAMLLDNCGL